ncbi:hypothetical protein BKI52_18935 [marine bacterium AO1-C]|nr:hypothetical protein BKI52_18935 [marine bacterium AO1-C]
MNFDKIKPEFLKKLDQHLLLHYPAVWHSKIIWAAFYAITAFTGIYFLGDYVDSEPYINQYQESSDFGWFFSVGIFLSGLMVIYWLYLQFQQKIDYSKLSFGKFLGVLFLNYANIILLFLPLVALITGGVLDLEHDQNTAWGSWHAVLYGAMPLSALPFVIRQFKLIEMILTAFFGFVYCLMIALVVLLFNDSISGGVMKQLPFIYILNFVAIGAFVVFKFNAKVYTQQTKRLGFLLLLTYPIVVPLSFFYIGDILTWGYYGRGPKMSEALIVGYAMVALMLVAYAVFTRFIYRQMMFPGKK